MCFPSGSATAPPSAHLALPTEFSPPNTLPTLISLTECSGFVIYCRWLISSHLVGPCIPGCQTHPTEWRFPLLVFPWQLGVAVYRCNSLMFLSFSEREALRVQWLCLFCAPPPSKSGSFTADALKYVLNAWASKHFQHPTFSEYILLTRHKSFMSKVNWYSDNNCCYRNKPDTVVHT